jgi:PAS domain S-box-containing protein
MPETIPRLLIVDDESAQMKALCDTLETEGYSTVGFTSASSALEALREQPAFDLVLSDLMMPEIDGIALLRAALEIDPNLVGIVMTGHGTIDSAVQAMQAGALDYILKPFKLSAVLPVLARALAVRRLRVENIQLQEALGIYKLNMNVALAVDIDAVLQNVADAALAQSRFRGVSILLPAEDGTELRVAVTRGEAAESVQDARVPFSAVLSGWVERSRALLAGSGELAAGERASAAPLGDVPADLSIPMLAGGKLVGILNFASERPRLPTAPGQHKALNILASVAAAAIERASLLSRSLGAEQRYRRLAESAPDIVFRYEPYPRPRVTYINPAVKAITGYYPEEFQADSKLILKIVYPDDRPLMERLLRGGSPSGNAVTVRWVHRNGNIISLEQRHTLVEEQNGRLAIEGIARDITGRQQLEEEPRTQTANSPA